MDGSPVASIWQRIEGARDTIVISSGSGLPWPRPDVARIVAIPLLASGEPVGSLVAGLRPSLAAQGSVERLEHRAELATAALAARKTLAALWLERKRQRAILQSEPVARIFVENGGRIGAMSRGAQELLGLAAPVADSSDETDGSSRRVFSELFQSPDRPKAEAWLQRAQAVPQRDQASITNPMRCG
jgi:PAS domain-containing protein